MKEYQPNKNFKCTAQGCDKSFTTNAHLSRHALNHSGIRKHKCDVPGCTSTFYRTDALNQHQKAHRRRQEQQFGHQKLFHQQQQQQQQQHHQMEVTPEPTSSIYSFTSSSSTNNPNINPTNLLLQAANAIQTQHRHYQISTITPPVSPSTLMVRCPAGLLQHPEMNGKIQSWISEQVKRRKSSMYFLKSPLMTPVKSPVQYRIPFPPSPSPPDVFVNKTSVAFLCD
ncbi:UNVERIFIED_CONTAM: hypothetical protein HDU68_007479 [Siphonaria sp. JEL0065]|nr:hypothetical protein HDU68_007479 [Siphonaria sp. JEL0065]